MIKLKDIDSNGKKIINYSRNAISYLTLLKETSRIYKRKRNTFHAPTQSGLNTRKYFRIVSNLLYIFEVTESIGFNMQEIFLDLDFAIVFPEN